MQRSVDIDFTGGMLVGLAGPQVHGERVAAELDGFAFRRSCGGRQERKQGSGATQRPAWIQQLRVEEPSNRLLRWSSSSSSSDGVTADADTVREVGCVARGEYLEKPHLPLLLDPLQLPEPLLQQRDGGEHHCAFVALHPH